MVIIFMNKCSPRLSIEQVVRDAARRVLDSRDPVRVYDHDEFIGVVDDEDILRVVVAEEDHPQ